MNSSVSSSDSIQKEALFGQIRHLILTGRDLFARRAERFRILSPGHSLEEYLAFLASLADAQQEALNKFPDVSLPDAYEQRLCREHGMPLLAARSWHRDPTWRNALSTILLCLKDATLPQAACETMIELMQAGESRLEEMADCILAGELTTIPPQELPFVAAALQVYWVQMASALDEKMCGRLEDPGVCPVCGSLPTVGIVWSGGAEHGLRYLSCSLCATQWHLVRIKCSRCESTSGISYYTLQGSDGAVKAESCNECGTYLKLMNMEKDLKMDAMADDLSTIALDMLMVKEGKLRGGPNLFFHYGS